MNWIGVESTYVESRSGQLEQSRGERVKQRRGNETGKEEESSGEM